MKNIALTGTQVFGVRRLTDKAMDYNEFLADGKTKNKLFGQSYHRYRFNGTVFTVNSNDPFIKAHEDGNIREINIIEREEVDGDNKVIRYELDYFVTNSQALGVATFDAKIVALTAVVATPATMEELQELA